MNRNGVWPLTHHGATKQRSRKCASLLYGFVLKQPAQRTPGLFPRLCDQNTLTSTFQEQKMCIVFQLKKCCPFFSNLILISLACILIILSLWLFVPFLGVSSGAVLIDCAYVCFILCIHVSSSPGSFQSKQKCFRGCFLLMTRVAPKAWGMSLSLDRQNS